MKSAREHGVKLRAPHYTANKQAQNRNTMSKPRGVLLDEAFDPTTSQMKAAVRGIMRAGKAGDYPITHVRVARHGFGDPSHVSLALKVLQRMQDMGYTDNRPGEGWMLYPQGIALLGD